jgi:VIT1/CCC1 family predicted Fe2+/Mn2+ transporter
MLNRDLKEKVLKAQRSEITDHIVYRKLSSVVKVINFSEILEHYEIFKEITNQEPAPDRLKIFLYVFISKVFGLNFGLRLMENGEDLAKDTYEEIKELSPKIEEIIRDERRHENELLNLIDEERLKYISSMVLGLNDALVELTGALAGFTLAIQNTRLIGVVGLITGIAASMSMAASEYLSTKQEETEKSPLKASIYTGFAYVGTVMLLIFPYLIFKNIFICLGFVIFNALLVILIFTFYISVAKELNFRKRFLEMAGLSLSIAIINFFIGFIIRKVFGVEV